MTRTIGGFPANEAYEWTPENQQRLGQIIVDLTSANRAERLGGYQSYYELRNRFLATVWREYLDRLNAMRAEKGFAPVEALVGSVKDEIVDRTPMVPAKLAAQAKHPDYTNALHGQEPISHNQTTQEVHTMDNVQALIDEVKQMTRGINEIAEALRARLILAPSVQVPSITTTAAKTYSAPVSQVQPLQVGGPGAVTCCKEHGQEIDTRTEIVVEQESSQSEPEDFAKLREMCKTKVLALMKTNKPALVKALGTVGAARLTEVADDKLVELIKALNEAGA